MDPNLTLAHITHNTAVGLLHQGIAYPSPEWQSSPIRIPSLSSADTCLAAATEVAIIAEQYLRGSTSLTNPQFAFCLFISGRMLLAHSLHYNIPLPSEFDSLTNSLKEISRRWNGPHIRNSSENPTDNLASKFASRLVQARDRGSHSLDIREAAYSEEQTNHNLTFSNTSGRELRSSVRNLPQSNFVHRNADSILTNGSPSNGIPALNNGHSIDDNMEVRMDMDQGGSPDSISLAFPPLPLAFQPHCVSATQTTVPSPIPSSNMHQQSFFYGRQSGNSFESTSNFDTSTLNYGSGDGFVDMNAFFDYPFLPTQRISMFSGPTGKEGEEETQ